MAPPSIMKFVRSSDGTPIYAEATGSPRNLHVVLVHGFSLSGVVFNEFCAVQRLLDELYIVRGDPPALFPAFISIGRSATIFVGTAAVGSPRRQRATCQNCMPTISKPCWTRSLW